LVVTATVFAIPLPWSRAAAAATLIIVATGTPRSCSAGRAPLPWLHVITTVLATWAGLNLCWSRTRATTELLHELLYSVVSIRWSR
jgi:hypothetical protein